MAGYVAAKEHIFARQQAGDCAVIGIDDEPSRAGRATRWRRAPGIACVPVALDRPVAGGVSYRAGMLVDADGYAVDFADVPTLPGDHNAQNAACAWAACRWLDVPREQIVAGLRSYPGLPHRQERVAAVGKRRLRQRQQGDQRRCHGAGAVELSTTSTGSSAARRRRAASAPLAPYFDRIRHAFLIGEATELFAGQLEGKLPYSRCGDLQSALDAAHARAQREARGTGGGAAVAGLRLVGPVAELRASRRCLPRHGAGAAGCRRRLGRAA